MRPFDAELLSQVSRRDFLLCGGLLLLAGCAGPAVRSQSPENAEMAALEKQVRLVESVAVPFGMNYVRAEGPALVVGLQNTGSDPPPSPQRAELLADMQARGVVSPNTVLASPTTSLVWVEAYLPPGAQKGDPLDIFVRVPPQNDTTSLYSGWLMETRLKEKAVLLDNRVHDGHVLAIGEGALLVDPLAPGEDKTSLLRARVLSGAHIIKNRNLGLVIKDNEKSVFLSKQIGDALNRRFHTYSHGTQQGIANPKTDTFIELQMHPRYKHNLPRYMRVVRSVAIRETTSEQAGRLKLLEKQLLDAVTCETAALRLEALGKEGIPILKTGMKSNDPEVRFYSAEALAYLDDTTSAKPLADAARNIPAFRAYALAALSSMGDVESSDELKALLDVPSAETRYGAFRALWGMNEHDPLIRGENLGDKFSLHVLNTSGEPMVHVTRSFRPEIVMFGPGQRLALPVSLEAGKSIVVNGRDGDQVTVSRFAVGEADQKRVVSNQVEDVLRAIVDLGGNYPDAVQFLQQAKANHVLACRLEVDALPNTERRYEHPKGDGSASGIEQTSYEVTTPLPNLFSNSAPKARSTESDAETAEKAAGPEKNQQSGGVRVPNSCSQGGL